MLGIAHTLVSEGLHDRAFLAPLLRGWPAFEDYLLGRSDGQPKDAAWAARDLPASRPTRSQRWRAGCRASACWSWSSHSLQRAEHGEQPVWMGAVLAAMLGQIGLPGGGYNYALGAIGQLRPPHQRRADRRRCRRARNGVTRLHPGGAHRRHAAQPGAAVRLQRPAR